jgi:hypothetical protein
VLGKGVVFGEGHAELRRQPHRRARDDGDDPPDAEHGLAPEDVDAITGVPMGHPKSASFRTADVVGLDTFVHVADNCFNSLVSDEERDVFEVPAYIRTMVEKKILGDKTKGGFYKRSKDGAIETLDPQTLDVPREGRRRGHQEGHEEGREDRGPARPRPRARGRHGQGRRVRVEGALRLARVLRAPHRRDHGQRGRDR